MLKKKLCGILSIMVIAGMGLTGCTGAAAASNSTASTQNVARGNLVIGLTADGNVALPVTNLNFELEGVVKKVYVNAGQTVKAGDLLAELDDSDYQIAITNAQNNLNKALVAYDDAVSSYEYSLKSNQYNLQSTSDKLNQGFDDYTYQTAINDAKTTLERREKELEEAKANALKEFDDYTYQLSINEAKITLDRKKADLEEAEKNLSDAVAKKYDEFDSYTYQNAVDNAQITYDRRFADYKVTVEDYEDAKENYEYYYYFYWSDEDLVESAKNKLTSAEKSMETAKRSLDDAQSSLDKAKTDYERAKENYNSSTSDSKNTAVEDAEKKVETAKNSVYDAERAYNKAVTELERAVQKASDDNITKLENAQTALEDAKTALQKAETNLERAKNDYSEQYKSTKNTYDLQFMTLNNQESSTSSITNAQLNIEEAKLKLKEAENTLEKVKVYAPIDGQILNVSLKEGEKATARDNSPAMIFGTGGSGSSFITLCDMSEVYITTNVSEGDIVGITTGQTVKVTIDSLGDESFSGTVYNVSNLPQTDTNGITTYSVTCRFDEANSELKDGMNALINFIKKEKEDVLLIPNKAVFIENGKQYVNVVKEDGSYEQRAVSCGLSNGTQTEVISGLSEGEIIVAGKVKA